MAIVFQHYIHVEAPEQDPGATLSWLKSTVTSLNDTDPCNGLELWSENWLRNWGLVFLFYNLIFWLSYTACGISAPHPGIEPGAPAVEAQS